MTEVLEIFSTHSRRESKSSEELSKNVLFTLREKTGDFILKILKHRGKKSWTLKNSDFGIIGMGLNDTG